MKGLPMHTALAPRARALRASLPAQEGHLASSKAGSSAPHEEQVVREVVELEGRSARTSDGCSPDLTTRCELGRAIRRFMVVV
jgi:hypothetical protein